IAVAREAAETVTELLTEMKGKIVSAQEDNVDRVKIQTDIDKYVGQINSVVSAAQFNGLNLVNGSQASVSVLASLDRQGSAVNASSISITAQDLSTGGYTANSVFSDTGDGTISDASDTVVLSLSSGDGEGSIVLEDG